MADSTSFVADFLRQTETEKPKLAKQIIRLDGEAHETLENLLSRFAASGHSQLGDGERKLAQRVIGLLHRASATGLKRMLDVLDYLDVNANQVLDADELALAVEILELFCRADSVNDTLSVKELDMLHAVLKHMDKTGSGKLDHDGRTRLRDELWDPDKFLAEQKANNPILADLMK